MAKQTSVAKGSRFGVGSRPDMARIYGRRPGEKGKGDFVPTAVKHGYNRATAEAAWHRAHLAIKGNLGYDRATALAGYLVRGQLERLLKGDRPKTITPTQWELLRAVAQKMRLKF